MDRPGQQERIGARMLAAADMGAGAIVRAISSYEVVPRATKMSIQTGPRVHIEVPELAALRHSCAPNVVVDLEAMCCRTIRPVARGEVLSYFYPSTEWEMSHPFLCDCPAAWCVRVVAGAKFLPVETLGRYFVSPNIRRMIADSLAGRPGERRWW